MCELALRSVSCRLSIFILVTLISFAHVACEEEKIDLMGNDNLHSCSFRCSVQRVNVPAGVVE